MRDKHSLVYNADIQGELAENKEIRKKMLTVPLNANVLEKHKSMARPVNVEYRTQYDRNRYRWAECVFLTQSGDKLTYTTYTPHYVIQSYNTVDFNLPHPLTINLQSVPYKLTNKDTILEVPDCTLETLKMFYNPNRPAYIKPEDLQTKVISIDGKRANLEYINPQKFMDRLDDIRINSIPGINHKHYQWYNRNSDDEIDFTDISKIYKIVTGSSVFEYEYLRHPEYIGDTYILKRIEELHNAASKHVALTKELYNGVESRVYEIPIAIFENEKQKVMWQGISQKVK